MRRTIAILVTQVFMATGLLFGQIIVSSIVGFVADPSGALVPGAVVTATNTQTGISVKATTGSQGAYSIPGLMAGTYDVTIEKPGFAPFQEKGISLASSETARVNAKLGLAGTQQAVTVGASTSMVRTDTMTVGGSVSARQLADLPTALQTIDSVLQVAPGVQPSGANPATGSTSPNIGGGSHWGSVNFNLNGMEVNDPGNSGSVTVQGTGGGSLVLPPPSALQELSVQSSNMSAQYAGHSTVTLVTKAGTNAFHGEAYEYLQNTVLNANTYDLNANGLPRPVDHLNQFGGNIGGPIKRDKGFFFFDYSGYRHAYESVAHLTLPSAAMDQGNFGALCSVFGSNGLCTTGTQLYNPFTGQPFANNQIPAGMIASQASAMVKYMPAPTVSSSLGLPNGLANYIAPVPAYARIDGEELRVDYNLSASDRVYGVFAQRLANPWGVASTTYPAAYGHTVNYYTDRNVSFSETHIFTPNMMNDLRWAFGDYATKFSGENLGLDPTSLFPQNPESLFHGLPTITASGYTGLPYDYGTGLFTPRKDIEINDDFTYVHGRHNLQAGLDETGYKVWNRIPSAANVTGAFSFTGSWTGNSGWPGQPHSAGNAFADFLIGTAKSSQTSATGDYASWLYARYWGVYVQDTWQVSPRLTLFYGVRYELQPPWHYRTQQVTTFDPVNNKLVLPEDSATPTLPANARADLFAAYPYETTQSIGLPTHFDQTDKNNVAPRLGFAFRPIGGDRLVVRGGYGVYFNFQPALVGSGREAFNPPWSFGISQAFSSKLPGKPTTPFLPDITFTNPYPGVNGNSNITPNPTLNYFQRDFKNARSQQWDLETEYQLSNSWAVRAAYIGNEASSLPFNSVNINLPVVQQPNVAAQAQRPYQPWGSIGSYLSIGHALFGQMQLGLKKRLSHGLTLQAEYQYSRGLDNVPQSGSPNIPGDYGGDWGNSDGLRRHWLVFNYDYNLPFGHGGTWLRNAHGVTNVLVGGWQVSGITTYGTGIPLTGLTFSQTGTGVVGWAAGRPDRVPGVSLYAGKQSGHDITDGVQWFNPAAFAPPAKWTYGNASRNLLFGPGYWNWDMSAMKTVPLHDAINLQFRADFLDAFNHLNLSNPSVTIADTRDGGTAVPSSGAITSGIDNRTIQLGLKLRF
ncbi:MAG TPA: TonB-dependent receptor [Acidobacteriaceae bacterium]